MLLDQLAPDLLLRLAQQRESLLALIQAERTAGNDDGARIKIEAECLRRIGLPLSVIRRSSPEMLIDLVQRGSDLTFRSIILAELLMQDGALSEKAGDVRGAVGSQLQAFCLIAGATQVLKAEKRIRYRAKLDELAAKLKAVSDDPYLRGKIEEYYAKM